MRKVAMVIAFIGALASCNNNTDLKVNGTVDGLENGNFIVAKIENNRPTNIDTVEVKNGKFTYIENLESPDFRLFILQENPQKGMFMFVGNDNITLTANIDSLDKVNIVGSKSQDTYKGLIDDFKKVQEEKGKLYQEAQMAQMQNDSIKLESLKDAIELNDKKAEKVVYDFADENKNSTLAPWALNTIIQKFEYETINPIYESFTQEVKDSKYGKELNERLTKLAKLAVGAVAPDFTLTTTEDKDFTLSEQKGKIVLIDFWAHWCKPCRAENPNNVALIKKYGKDGFTIAGISVDRPADKDKWLQAITADGINYTQMLDTKEVNKEYDVRFIPTTILLDKEGKIIAKNLRGEELAEKLAEIFGH